MSEIVVLIKEIIICPECIRNHKTKRFSNVKDLNIHLKMKHRANYKLNGQLSYSTRTS